MNKKTFLLFGVLLSLCLIDCTNLIIEVRSQSFQPYKFIVIGDIRNDEDDNTGLIQLSSLLTQVMSVHEIDFILHSGDIVQKGGIKSQYDTYYWPLMTDITTQVPIYYAVGNHEYESFSGLDKTLQAYLENVENPGNEIYYSFNSPQKDTHFIVLNTEYVVGDYGKDSVKQQAQREWLEADFASNTIDRIIVMTHRPFWGLNPSPDRIEPVEELRDLWHPLFLEQGVEAVFSGHAHLFYETLRNGVRYTTSGGGTSDAQDYPLEKMIQTTKIQETWQEDDVAFVDFHLCLVEVSETGYDVDVTVTNGSTVHEYFIPPVLEVSGTYTTREKTASPIASTIVEETTAKSTNFSLITLIAIGVILLWKKQR
ncbi:MAG: metallophosphoesterase family protein [Candidatus Hodarchaeales archaeon]